MPGVAEIAILLSGRDELSSILNTAKEALTEVGNVAGELLGGLGEVGQMFGEVGGEIGNMIPVVSGAVLALGGLAALFVGDLLEGARSFGLELEHLTSLTGISADAAAGLVVGLGEVGLNANDVSSSLGIFSKNLETMADSASNAADAAGASSARASQAVADAQANLAQAYADTQERIQEATDNEKQNLDDLAEKHADTVARIKEQISQLTSDFAEAEQDRLSNFQQSAADRKQNFDDSQASLAESHSLSVASIAERERTATTAAARQSAAFAMQQENERYAFAAQMAKKKEAEQDASDKRRFAEEERKAKESYAKQQAALEQKLKDEDDAYAKQTEREQQRYDLQLKHLNEAYAKQETATAQHIARTEAASGGGGGGTSAFEQELQKILAAGGETQDQIKAQFAAIDAGTPDVEGLLRGVANGFQAQSEAAKNGGDAFNMAGEAAKLFGRSGATLLPFLTKGAAGWDAATAKARQYGLTIGTDGVEHSMEFTKAQADMNFALEGVKEQIGLELMPVAERFFDFLANWISGHKEEIQGFFEDVGNKAKEFGLAIVNYLLAHKEEIAEFLTKFAEDVKTVGDDVLAVIGFFHDHWPEIEAVLQTAWAVIHPILLDFEAGIQLIQGALDLLHGDWGGAWTDIKNSLQTEWNAMQLIFDDILAVPLKILGAFTTGIDWGRIKTALEQPFLDAWNWLQKIDWVGMGKSIIADIVSGIGSAPVSIIKALADQIPGGSKILSVAGGLIGRAGGGDVTGGVPYIVGERGPEVFVPGRSGSIIANGQMAGGGLTVNFHGPVTLAPPGSGADQLRSVGFAVAQQMRSRGLRMIT